ncbi:glycerol-3-phosphate acyltransferase [Deinococcus peraridilitoris]|uniref:Glycerol-3-phosphate acyltransferase n=1 Tax=Deinococcus peraridilitoris (strain DSM 19664 / LMG 22246 / CIP 109416 / KR-200) TaxID=937777 RepID=L0A5W2_DEIPD|nr:glycerol-3-phosphate acyltransferase [Deinococcus peraridilitoris]AFZ68410.1 putative membrane protein [Deinococcus peraridilitoris DSM 19664]
MPVLVALIAYLLGSLIFGVIYSRARGHDVRAHDAPGASGIYRQYGIFAALLVFVLDILKGSLAVLAAQLLAPDWTWLAVGAVIIGHNYPVFFGFNGGAGIAPLIGALAVSSPVVLLVVLGVGLLFIPLYRRLWQTRLKLAAVPAASLLAVPLGLLFAARTGELPELLAGAVAMAVRSVQLLRQ